jgi:HlyD family secretion protein
MLSKIFKKIISHKLLTGIMLLLIIGGGYFGYQRLAGDKNTVQYVTAAVEKGTLIVSVSGSGQVTVLDQVDVKPKVSGDITTLYINKDEEVKMGQILAELDSGAAQIAIRDAEVALESAKIKLDELLAPPDAQSILQAENALSQAERDLEKAKKSQETVETDAESTLASAYEDGYSDVSTAFFKLSDYMKDLQDVLGTEESEQEYVSSYKLLLGQDSLFIQKLLDDYYQARDLYNKNFTFFREVFRDDNHETIYQLINDTLETTKTISQALESARHMYDAIIVGSYTKYSVSSTVDKMQPKIESDLSSIFSDISSLQKTIDTIDGTLQDTPDKIKDAELALKLAQEKLEEKKLALEELMAGADSQDIKSQQNIVAQKEDALLDAKEKLANCFVRAPFDGAIAEVNVKKGDSVSSGTTLATLITKQKIAEISLNEVDAAKVKVGQKATLTFDALPEVSISGKVMEIDTVGTVAQGVVSYKVKISFDTEEEKVKPGMSATADIITDAKQDVLVLPNGAIKSQGNSYYVELIEASEEMRQQLLASVSGTILPEPPKLQPVETGLSNDLSTEIVSGLKEGDIVVTSTISPNKVQTTQTQTNQSRGTQEFQIPGMMR